MQNADSWVIDTKKLAENNRSFSTMVGNLLCPKCYKKLKIDHGEAKEVDILKSLKTCCSKSSDFISSTLPLQESVFRVLLSNGNVPITLDEMGRELSHWRGTDFSRNSPTVLSRLLENDQHYGFKIVRE